MSFFVVFFLLLVLTDLPRQTDCQFFTKNAVKTIPRMGRRSDSSTPDATLVFDADNADLLYHYLSSVSVVCSLPFDFKVCFLTFFKNQLHEDRGSRFGDFQPTFDILVSWFQKYSRAADWPLIAKLLLYKTSVDFSFWLNHILLQLVYQDVTSTNSYDIHNQTLE